MKIANFMHLLQGQGHQSQQLPKKTRRMHMPKSVHKRSLRAIYNLHSQMLPKKIQKRMIWTGHRRRTRAQVLGVRMQHLNPVLPTLVQRHPHSELMHIDSNPIPCMTWAVLRSSGEKTLTLSVMQSTTKQK